MEALRIRGGQALEGEVRISGSKNAALPIFAAALLTEEPCVIHNVPDLSDIRFMAKILQELGAKIEQDGANTYVIHASSLRNKAPYDLVRRMRASVCLLGPLAARLAYCSISLPGGCVIGTRPLDLHLKGLQRLGCNISIKGGYIEVDSRGLHGANLFLGGRHGSTVTGTANILMAAVLAPGVTLIESAACEPEIVDLCHFLQAMGAHIEGVGSHCLMVEGVDRLHGCEYTVIPDRIEAGTFIIAASITRGKVTLQDVQISHLYALLDTLEIAQVPFELSKHNSIHIDASSIEEPQSVDLVTHAYPGFPTDLQAQMCSLMSVTPGLSVITERVYPSRFMHVPELQRMGADITIEGCSAIIKGGSSLSGAPVMASDLRASAALILAGLAAEGETWVQRLYHLDRGYESMETKLKALGADIERLPQEAIPDRNLQKQAC